MSTVISAFTLANGLRGEFDDTYGVIRNRQAESRLSQVMDLGIGATNRQHEFAYFEAAPHMTYWRRGDSVPTDAMGSVTFTVQVYEWARRVPWSKWDRMDDQTQSLYDMARMAGESAALLPVRFFFDLILNSAGTLPAIPLAPDGAAMFATTAGGSNRFGVSGGNVVTGSGVTTVSQIQTDYYNVIERFKQMQDGKGQPLFSDETVDQGITIIHGAHLNEVMDQAFLQKRQGVTYDAAGAPDGTGVAAAAVSNVVQDSSRTVELWGTQRIGSSENDWFCFLKAAPKKATFILDRQGVQEFSALEGDNNSDHVRDVAEEYVQWESRMGAGIARLQHSGRRAAISRRFS